MLFRQVAQDMNVIFRATHGNGMTFQSLQNARLVRPYPRGDVLMQPRAPFFCGENDVNAQAVQGLWHGVIMPENGLPLQGEYCSDGLVTEGDALGYYGQQPFRLRLVTLNG